MKAPLAVTAAIFVGLLACGREMSWISGAFLAGWAKNKRGNIMKYKSGDKVRVRPSLTMENPNVTWEMAKLAGKILTISYGNDYECGTKYSVKENDYIWNEDDFIDINENASISSNDTDETDPIPLNVKHHKAIVLGLNNLYRRKNKDYGDSFHLSYLEEGMAMPRIRLSDKLNRFKSLTKNGKQEIKDESIRDTLLDLANYAIMTVMEIDREKESRP